MNLYEEFEWRGLVYGATEGLTDLLASQKVTGYIGFDPTAASLHVGSLLPIMGLVHMQRLGHSPIAIVGGGTGMIGDPSGKTQERQLLTSDQVTANLHGIRAQLARFLDFDKETNPARMDNNADWLCTTTLVDFLRDIGKHFSVNYMMAKESVKRRLEQEEGISYTEFTYLMLQAYDFLVLHDKYGCVLQMGGSDQWGNITAGTELIRRMRGTRAYGLVFPLLTTSSGIKFGKTETGTIWLDEKLTSPFRFYQFWFNTPDEDVVRYLKYFTMLSKEQVEGLAGVASTSPEKREAQRMLAQEVTRLVHGEAALVKAEAASRILFGAEITDLNSQDVLDIFAEVPSSQVNIAELSGEGIAAIDLVTNTGLVKSRGEAKRLIQAGGVYLNNVRVPDAQRRVLLADAIDGRVLVLRKGVRQYNVVRVV